MHKTTKRDFRFSQKGRITRKQGNTKNAKLADNKDAYFLSLSREQQELLVGRMESVGMNSCANYYKKLMKED